MMDMASVIVPKSDQINADDLIAGPMTVTITGVQIAGGTEQPVSISIAGTSKVYRPCKSMSRVLVAAWGADASKYQGRSLTLYRDPAVKWGGMAVGGIRISHMTHIENDLTLMLTMTKQNRAPHRVKVLVADSIIQSEAREVAKTGMVAFKNWLAERQEYRPACTAIWKDIKAIADAADAAAAASADPFGLPDLGPMPTDEERAAAMAAAMEAARAGDER